MITSREAAGTMWSSSRAQRVRSLVMRGRETRYSGVVVAIAGVALETVLIGLLDRALLVPNPGILFLPLVAFVAYYWNLRNGVVAAAAALVAIIVVLLPPMFTLKPLDTAIIVRLVTDVAALIFILALARLAASRRDSSEREASRFASLTSIGLALASELDEEPLLKLIAQTACDLTGANFAAFTLRPVDMQGQPLVPSRGDFFHLAAIVGVTPEEEERLRHIPLGGEGLLAPIFQHARSVRVGDAMAMMARDYNTGDILDHRGASGYHHTSAIDQARAAALSYARGESTARDLKSVGLPKGHPAVRSFLGAPMLDRLGHVRGGLLLGHAEPDRFTDEDERLLVGLASQAATALENARLFSASQSRAAELDAIFESISDGIALIDRDGKVVHENRAARSLLAQLTSADNTSAATATSLKDLVQRAINPAPTGAPSQAGDPLVQTVVVNDEMREYLVSVAPVRIVSSPNSSLSASNGAPQNDTAGAVFVWHDVTETRQLIAERRAREDADVQRRLLQTIVDELPSGVFLAQGSDARLILANRAASSVWGAEWQPGQPMAAFLGKSGVHILRPDGQPMREEELATIRSLRTGEAIRYHEEIIRRPDGGHLPVLMNTVIVNSSILGTSLRAEAPRTERTSDDMIAIVVLQDVTALKEAERLKDEFIAMAAHELKTPMAAVKGYSEMLIRGPSNELGAPLEDWQQEALEAIDTATTRLVELTNDLLDVARLQANRMELRREPTDLIALARRVSRRMQVTTQRHKITVKSNDEYVVASVDAPRIEQVLGNLLSNAIKYSPDGGDVLVTVSMREGGQRACITVRDAGIGIPKEQQSKLFARFVRADNAIERSIGGTGLGLYLSREILTRHSGRIWLDSEVDQGSEFSIEVPTGDTDGDGRFEESADGATVASSNGDGGILAPASNPRP